MHIHAYIWYMYVFMCVHAVLVCVFIDLKQLLTQFQEKDNIQPPDEYELKGAIKGLGRLQSIYNINADEMANGHKHG